MADNTTPDTGLLAPSTGGGIDPALLEQLKNRLLAPTPIVRPDQTPVEQDGWNILARLGNALGGAGVVESLSPRERQQAGFRALGDFGTGLMAAAHYQPGKTIFSNLAQGFEAADRSVLGSERAGAQQLAARQAALTEAQKQQIEGIKAALPLLQTQGALRGLPTTLLGPTGGNTSIGAATGTFFDTLAQIESGDSNIVSRVDKDSQGRTLAQGGNPAEISQGHFQINPGTWRDFAGKAGVDVTKYPNPMSAPRDVQAAVAAVIPLARFGPRTQTLLRQKFGPLDTGQTIGGLAGSRAAPAPAASQAAPAAAPTPTAAPTTPPAGRAPLPSPEPAVGGQSAEGGAGEPGTVQVAGKTGAPTGTTIPASPPGSPGTVASIVSGMVAAGADPATLEPGPGSRPGMPPGANAQAQLSPLPPGMDANSREAYGILHPIVPPPEMQKLFNPQPDPDQMAAIATRKANAEKDYQAARLAKDPVAATAAARQLFDKATADENTLRENARQLGVNKQAEYYKDRNAALDAAWAAEVEDRRKQAGAERTQTNAIELERIKSASNVYEQGALVALKTDEKRLGKMADAADAAQTMSNSVRQLVPIIKNLPPDGVLSSAVGAFPQVTGALKLAGIISPETADNISLFRGVTEHLATQLRVAGSGSMSDKDLDTFKAALPQMIETPDGRLKAAAFLQNLADRVVAEQAFAVDYFRRKDPDTGKPAHNLSGLNKAINAPRDQGGLGEVVPHMPKFEGPNGYNDAVAWIEKNVDSGHPYMVWEQAPNGGRWTQQLVVKE